MENSKATKSQGTILNYNATLTRLKGFSEYRAQEITFQSINQSFYEAFMNYLIREHKSLNNTVGRHIKVLKVFLNYCKRMEIIPAETNLSAFKVIKEEADIIYLTENELFKLLNLEGLNKSLQHVKITFVSVALQA